MKFKKLMAVVMAGTMIMGMASVASAAEGDFAYDKDTKIATADVTVKSITDREATSLTIKQTKAWNDQTNQMVDVSTLQGYKPYENTVEVPAADTTYTWEDLAAGVYEIKGSGTLFTYSTMTASTFDQTAADASTVTTGADDIKASDCEVDAKSEYIKTEKTASDTTVHAGQTVTFEIKGTVPYVLDDATDKKYVLYDQPSNLNGLALTNEGVTIGGNKVDATLSAADKDGVYSIDLTKYLENNAYVGQNVVVHLTATVSGDQGYTNTGWSNRDKSDSKSTVKGYEGNITLTKYAYQKENDDDITDNTKLSGAVYEVYTKAGDEVTYLKFDDKNVYNGETSTESEATPLTTTTAGTIKITGLSEGTYYFKEITAPTGYTVNTTDVSAKLEFTVDDKGTVTDEATATTYMIDTKLSGLPSTGGIGTTVFTIAGVVIIVGAAGIFFASRRKKAN